MGYQDAAASVSRDSGYELENPTVATFRSAVLNGDWSAAERLLLGAAESESDAHGDQGNGLVLSKGADRNLMRFWIRQQKFLELLEQQEANRALVVLREELKPLHKDIDKLHFLSSLLMTPPTDLKAKAQWDGAAGQSRKNLLTELSSRSTARETERDPGSIANHIFPRVHLTVGNATGESPCRSATDDQAVPNRYLSVPHCLVFPFAVLRPLLSAGAIPHRGCTGAQRSRGRGMADPVLARWLHAGWLW
jgi:hypothetical protein